MTGNNKRDPMFDPESTVEDFVYRLRRMGYPGNVRVEFPIFTPGDVAWCATILDDLNREILAVRQSTKLPPLVRVLRARAALVKADRELKLRTTHKQVQKMKHVAGSGDH
jgi:hypothetical protein